MIIRREILIGLLGLFVGYGLGLIEVHKFLLNYIPKGTATISYLISIIPQPNLEVLTELATLDAAIFVFLIPLSIDIVSKISERYKSNVITNSLKTSIWGLGFPAFLLIHMIAAILLKAFSDTCTGVLCKIISLIMLVSAGYIIYQLYQRVTRIYLYMNDEENVINQLSQDAEQALEE